MGAVHDGRSTGVGNGVRMATTASPRRQRRSWRTTVAAATVVGISLVAVPASASTDGPTPAAGSTFRSAGVDHVSATRLIVTFDEPRAAHHHPADGAQLRATGHEPSAVQVLEFGSPEQARAAAERLRGRPEVLAVEPDRVHHLQDGVSTAIGTDPVAVTAAGDLAAPWIDGLTSRPPSWGVHNDGSSIAGRPGQPRIDVGAAQVWPLTTGREVVVAVVDSGVDWRHPLLEPRMWVNPGETPDGRDSDGNGYPDDLIGWNFYDDSPHVFVDAREDRHGTHVAGIIAGEPLPEIGFVGVAPSARIMSLKVSGPGGSTTDSLLIEAFRYAAANGADIVNLSMGSLDPAPFGLITAIAELGIPLVAAAGNHGARPSSPVTSPANLDLPHVLSVAAHDHAGQLAPFSSRDRHLVDVAAPGTAIPSTLPGNARGDTFYIDLADGTSMAAPHVAGVLALALERHPDADGAALVDAVRATVRPLDSVSETRSSGIVRAPALLDALGTRVPACTDPPPLPFTDVRVGGAHHDAVACMRARQVTRGTSSTTYGAGDPLSHAQIATMVANALDPTGLLPGAPTTSRFVDLDGSPHRSSIERLAEVGIVTGNGADRYEPHRQVTRAEFAAIVVRATEWLAQGEIRATGPGFDDTSGHPHATAIDRAAGLRIVSGRSAGTFGPDEPLRRDQAASMVNRTLDRLVQHGLLEAS